MVSLNRRLIDSYRVFHSGQAVADSGYGLVGEPFADLYKSGRSPVTVQRPHTRRWDWMAMPQ